MEGSRGVTLIELLVSIFIIGLFTMIVIPSYGRYSEQVKLKGAAEQVKSALLEAQSLALNPRAVGSDIGQFKNESGPCYQLLFGLDVDRGSLKIVGVQNQFSYLPKGIVFSSLPTPNPIVFCQNDKGGVNNISDDEIIITIHSNKLNQDKQIKIQTKTGIITVP